MKNPLKSLGPGTLIAAAFIGPGTVTVCSLAGIEHQFTLLWAMLLSIVATMVLQEMSVRVGLVYDKGLAASISDQIKQPAIRYLAVALILSAIFIGNTAYEAGNISGGVLGLDSLTTLGDGTDTSDTFRWGSLLIGGLAGLLLFFGNYKQIEKLLIAMVVLMSISFVLAAVITTPNIASLLKGMFMPSIPKEGIITVVALVGTTVVPYNLFLHASLVRERWKGVAHLKAARRDTYVSILLGGLVSMAIIVCAAGSGQQEVASVGQLASGLTAVYGKWATAIFSIGMIAAGITSAITAPLAAAYVVQDCFGWEGGIKSIRFRAVWSVVLIIGIVFSSLNFSPISIIKFAQVANGILLPVVAFFLLWIVNRKAVVANFVNSVWQNIIGLAIVCITLLLGARALFKVFKIDFLF